MVEVAKLKDLLERVEKATGADIALACDIHAGLVAVIPKRHMRGSASGSYIIAHGPNGRVWTERVPEYTTSIDACVALIAKALPWHTWYVAQGINGSDMLGSVAGVYPPKKPEDTVKGDALTPPLALLAALLKALIAQEESTLSEHKPGELA